MSATSSSTSTATVKRKIRPARKQVKPGEIDKSEGPQPGKEYSESLHLRKAAPSHLHRKIQWAC